MSLTTYANIRSAILDWQWTQGGLTDAIIKNDIFPQLWSIMYHGDRTNGMQPIEPLRVKAMVSAGTITTDANGDITIATGVNANWLEFIEITPVLAGSHSLNYMDPWSFRKQSDALQNTTPPPVIYTVEGDTLHVAPKVASTGLSAVWYQKFTALSADSDTDWIVTNAPHVYMRGGLFLACDYTQDDRRAQWRAEFAGAIKALNMNDQKRRASGGTPVARPRTIA